MKNSDLNNEYLDDQIDLIVIIRTLYSSKKLIILITLASALLAFIYIAQKEVQYQSTVFIEIGSYDLLNGEKKQIEPVLSLIKKLKINQISQELNKLNFNSIEDHFLEINYVSPSPEFNEELINEVIRFIEENHAEILDSIVNSFSEKIVALDNEIEFLINLLKEQKEILKLIAMGTTSSRGSEKDTLIYSRNNNQIDTLIYSRNNNQIQTFKLQQEKDTLELQTKLVNDQTNTTRSIREIETTEIKTNNLEFILIGTILGFIFSVFIVFIRQAFLKEQN